MTGDNLKDYPCNPLRLDSRCTEQCLAGDAPCERRDIYRAHIKLRNDMRKLREAVLGDMTPRRAREIYRAAALHCRWGKLHNAEKRLVALADIAAKL